VSSVKGDTFMHKRVSKVQVCDFEQARVVVYSVMYYRATPCCSAVYARSLSIRLSKVGVCYAVLCYSEDYCCISEIYRIRPK